MSNVVISAFGAVTPLGSTYDAIKHSLYHGISGIKEIKKFSCDSFVTKHAGIPCEGNDAIKWPSKTRRLAETFYAQLVAERLLSHPNFPKGYYRPEQIGCIIGVDEPAADIQLCLQMKKDSIKNNSKIASLNTMLKHFKLSDCLNLEPSSILNAIYEVIPFENYAATHVGLCSASLQAIGMGMQALKQGVFDAVIVGGVSGKVNPLNLARLELMDVISTDLNLKPQQRSRPFDEKRSGFVLAEGAVLFLLENEAVVQQRQGDSLLKVLGYGSSLGAEHIVIPHKESLEMKLSMQRALVNAGIQAEQVDCINAHATSTILNDIHESIAINEIFKNNSDIPVTANKSLHGHLIAAAGAMEVLNCLITIKEEFIPGVINLEKQDSQCNINVIKKSQKSKLNIMLKNSFGMGGLAASLILGRGGV